MEVTGILKRHQLAFLVASAIAFFCSPAMAQQNWASKMFETRSHDFRTVGRGAKSVHEFKVTNIYEEEVHIAAVRTSCGCTTPSISKQTLQSRESGSIIAKFNTDTFIGTKAATLTVVFDKPFYQEVQLKVRGNIRTDVWFEPAEIDFGEIAPGKTGETEIVINHSGNSNWRITDVRSHCTDLQVRLSKPELTPGLVKYRMVVKTKDSMSDGEIRERLTLISNDRAFPTTEMLISGHMRPVLSISPASLSLGTLSPGKLIEKRLLIRGEEPFSVTGIVCPDKRFEFNIPEGKKKLHMVKVKFSSQTVADKIAQQIRVTTDLDGDKFAEILVTGSVGTLK